MVENDIKGWYGSFSLAGKDSAEKYGISKIQDLLSEKTKKKYLKIFLVQIIIIIITLTMKKLMKK